MIPGMAAVKYDVCVIGSGAAGGVMTKQLCEVGAKVVLLEAGREVKYRQDRTAPASRREAREIASHRACSANGTRPV